MQQDSKFLSFECRDKLPLAFSRTCVLITSYLKSVCVYNVGNCYCNIHKHIKYVSICVITILCVCIYIWVCTYIYTHAYMNTNSK